MYIIVLKKLCVVFRKHLKCIDDREVNIMCDVQKYSDMYKEMKILQPEDTLQLVMEAKDEEERFFFEMIGNFFLQQKQKKVIKGNMF